MKILHLIDSLEPGGKERQLIELLKGLSNLKCCELELVVMNEDIHYQEVFNFGIKIHYLIRRLKKDPTIFLKLYKICKQFKPNIIHTWDFMTSIYALPLSRYRGVKLVNGSIRNATAIKPFTQNWVFTKFLFHMYDNIVSNSYAGLDSYKVPARKGMCIHNGFDFCRIKTVAPIEQTRRRFNISTDKIVGMVASSHERKDYRTYILAAQQVLSVRNDVTFLAIGEGNNLEKYKNTLESEFKSKILFLGRQNDVESIVNVFDVGVLATNRRKHGEGISNSIMEYMACEKPVVATRGGGTPELIIDSKTGFLINSYSPQEMSEKILFLLDNKVLAEKMGKVGKKRIETEFSLDRMVNSYFEMYNRILLRQHPQSPSLITVDIRQ